MFFKQVRRNAAKNRKTNALFYFSLIVAIVAFYTLLSLGEQDVIRYLRHFESDAINKLLQLIPIIYGISLFFVYYLVYFACRFQLESRKRELGLYLMMGMRRLRLFGLLMTETLWNSVVSILIGLPLAILLTEVTGLVTVKWIGIDVLEHRIAFSPFALGMTIMGFFGVQFISMVRLSYLYSSMDPMTLLNAEAEKKQKKPSALRAWISFALGAGLLIYAYYLGINKMHSLIFSIVVLIIVLGACGTLLFFKGLATFIGKWTSMRQHNKSGLYVFTSRQLQENVLYQNRTMAVSSLLVLMALACLAYGISVAGARGSSENRRVDFSIQATEDQLNLLMKDPQFESQIKSAYPMKAENTDQEKIDFSWGNYSESVYKVSDLEARQILEQDLEYLYEPYLIPESSFNALLEANGQDRLYLHDNEAVFYSSESFRIQYIRALSKMLPLGVYVEMNHQKLLLREEVYSLNIVSDRTITLSKALVVKDDLYDRAVRDPDWIMCMNIHLRDDVVEEKGLMKALADVSHILNTNQVEHESFLTGIGRNMFYMIAGSYLTIYWGILFLVIANTVMGLRFLIIQRGNLQRYRTLMLMGAQIPELISSAKQQVRLYFGLTIGVSCISGYFAVRTLFGSFLKLEAISSINQIYMFAVLAIIGFLVIEFGYIRLVEHYASREISALQQSDRGTML